MAEELSVKLPPNIKAALDELAAKTEMSPSRLLALFAEGIIEGGGTVYTAPWLEGPGIRALPDWPRFSAKVYKIKQEEMK